MKDMTTITVEKNAPPIAKLGDEEIPLIEALDAKPAQADLLRHICEWKAKQPRTIAFRENCAKIGVDPNDPLAEEKIKLSSYLTKCGATLAELEGAYPGFWNLPRETEKREGEESLPSRNLLLSHFLHGRKDAAERQKKRKAKIKAKGWPEDYYERSPAEQRTINNRLSKRRSRAKRAGAVMSAFSLMAEC